MKIVQYATRRNFGGEGGMGEGMGNERVKKNEKKREGMRCLNVEKKKKKRKRHVDILKFGREDKWT